MYQFNIELAISDLEIMSSDCDEVQVHIKNSRNGSLISIPESISIKEEHDMLIVKETIAKDGFNLKEIGKFFTGETKSLYLLIEVPKSYSVSHAFISLKTGDLRLNAFKCAKLDIKALAGDVKGNHLEIESLSASLAAGDIKLKGTMKEVDIDVKAGDVKLSPSTEVTAINIRAAVGDIRLELPNASEFAVFSDLTLGDFKQKRFDGPVTFDASSEKKISVKANVGDFRIYHSF